MDTAVSGTDIFASQGSSSHTNRRASTYRACGFFFTGRVLFGTLAYIRGISTGTGTRFLPRGRGDTPRWGADGGVCRLLYDVQQTFSLGPCAATVQRAPSHNRWGVSETTLPAKTHGRTLDGPFNFPPPRVAGWLLMCLCQVCNWAAVASVATGPHHVVLQHHVESRLSVVVEWRHHSNQAGTPCRATNPQSGGRRPKKRLRRHGTMADGPRRHWCAYQRRCGNAGSLVSTHRRAPPAGDRPEESAGTNPKTGGHQPKDWQALPFHTVGDHEFFLDFGDCVFELARGCGTLVWGLVLSFSGLVFWYLAPFVVVSCSSFGLSSFVTRPVCARC